MKWERKGIYGFGFYEGDAIYVEERGFCANRGGEVSVPLLATWPAMEEREKGGALMVEVGGSEWRGKLE